MSEEAPKSVRGVQVVMLGFVASFFVLSDPTIAEERLRRAQDAVRALPSNAIVLRETLESACVGGGWVFDVPPSLKLSWFESHLGGERHVWARGYRVRDPKEGVGRCRALEDICRAATSASTNSGAGDEKRCHEAGDWHALRTVGQPASLLQIDAILRGSRSLAEAKQKVKDDEASQRSAEEEAVKALSLYGAGSNYALSARQTAGLKRTVAADSLKESDTRNLAYTATLEFFRKESISAVDSQEQAGGTHLLVGSDKLALYLILRAGLEPFGDCAEDGCPREFSHRVDAEANTVPEACLEQRDVRLMREGAPPPSEPMKVHAPAPSEPLVDKACTDGVPSVTMASVFDVDALTSAGVWSDLRDLDSHAALAALEDKASHAELEGEVFGLKLHSKDALRWIWLPVLALELYALRLLFEAGGKLEEEEIWSSRTFQFGLASCAAIVVWLSLRDGLTSDDGPSSIYERTVYGACILGVAWSALSLVAAVRSSKAMGDATSARRDPLP